MGLWWVQMIKEQLECLISPPLMFQLELNHLPNTQVLCLAMATLQAPTVFLVAPQTPSPPWFTHLCCGPLTCRARHVVGPPRSTKQRSITHYLKQGPLPCRRCLEVKYSLILVASAALPSRAGSSLWIHRHFESPSPAGARRWEVGIALPPLLAGTPTAGRELQPEQPPKSEPSHMFRTAAPPVSA